jgi:hypothetical protein
MTTDLALAGASLPAIVGLVEAAKSAGLPTRFAPLAALATGELAALAGVYGTGHPWALATSQGVAMGLAASGLYHGTKTVAGPNMRPRRLRETHRSTRNGPQNLSRQPPPTPSTPNQPQPPKPTTENDPQAGTR